MQIALGADHRGYEIKEFLKQQLTHHHEKAIEWIDVGCFSADYCDYPVFAHAVAQKMLKDEVPQAILICGSGIGMAITVNRYAGLYAGVVWNEKIARLSKEHDNVNILVLPSDYIELTESVALVTAWLNADFLGGKYQRRLTMIDE